jgi:hypothetical protein
MESNKNWLVRTGTLAGLFLVVFSLAPQVGQGYLSNQRAQRIDSLTLTEPAHEAALRNQTLPQELSIKSTLAGRFTAEKNRDRSGKATEGRRKTAPGKHVSHP